MSISATLVLGIGPIIGKALLKILLDDRPLLKELAPDLLDWLKDQTKGEREQRAGAQQIGAAVAVQLRPIIDEARLTDHELVPILSEFVLTLNQIGAEQLVDTRLVSARLTRSIFEARPEVTRTFSAREAQLYERLVREASVYVAAIASEFLGFSNLRDARLLQDSERICESVLTLLKRPDEESERFGAKYREVIQRELSKLELFGIRRLDQAFRKQKLGIAYVTVRVDRTRSYNESKDENAVLLNRLLGDMSLDDDAHTLKERSSSPIDDVLVNHRRIVIRGDAGSGKTTLLQWIAITAASNNFKGALILLNNSLPFFIRLRQVADQGFPSPEHFTMLVAKQIAGSQPHGWVHEQLYNGRAIVMIDGIDELPEGKREAFLEQVQDLVRDYPNARYIITSRPAALSSHIWPEWHIWTQEEQFAEVAIKPMSNQAVEEFIDHWHIAYAEGITDLDEQNDIRRAPSHLKHILPRRPELKRLASNPLLCAMLCALHYEKRHQLPSSRMQLYDSCIEMLLEQRDKARDIRPVDYPNLSLDQKMRLLQQLAYRMMRNGESELLVETVDAQLEEGLPRLGVDIAVKDIRRYFVQRSGLLREPVEGRIDFTHRTFQEYLTAQAIARLGEVGFLMRKLHDDQWQETIILAAGKLQIKQSERLMYTLLDRTRRSQGVSTKAQLKALTQRRRLLALALACLGTGLDISPALRQEVLEAAQELFPPYLPEQQKAVASAGELAIRYLLFERQPNIAAMVACIRTLALIGGEKALAAIEGYRDIDHNDVHRAIDEAWLNFDNPQYARRLLKHRKSIRINDLSLLPGLTELTQLQELNVSGIKSLSDLSTLGNMPQLQTLNLSNTQVRNINGLAGFHQLQKLYLIGTPISNLSDLSQMPNLQDLSIWMTRVNNLSFLVHLPNLQLLHLGKLEVSDLSFLQYTPKLTDLFIWDTLVSDLNFLVHVPNLKMLNFGKTSSAMDGKGLSTIPEISDLIGLRHCTNLQTLFIWNIAADDLSFLP